MLYFPTWKVTLILAVCALGVIFSLPNLFQPGTLAHLPDFLPKKQVSLGLDLRGGSHLLLEVDMASVERERLNGLVDELRTELRNAKIDYTGLTGEQDRVTLTLTEPNRLEDLRSAARKIDPDLTITSGDNGLVT